jgi:hypothetical protein
MIVNTLKPFARLKSTLFLSLFTCFGVLFIQNLSIIGQLKVVIGTFIMYKTMGINAGFLA